MTEIYDCLMGSGPVASWLEAQSGVPPWVVVGIIIPLIIFLFVFLIRGIVISLLSRLGKIKTRLELWRRVSFFAAVLIGLLGVGVLWRLRIEWVAQSLKPVFGGSGSVLRAYVSECANAILTILLLVFVLYLIQKAFRFGIVKTDALTTRAKGLRFRTTTFLEQF